jgi:hypothetical protein
MGLPGEYQLDRAYVSGQRDEAIQVGEDQIRPLIHRGPAREPDRKRSRIQPQTRFDLDPLN